VAEIGGSLVCGGFGLWDVELRGLKGLRWWGGGCWVNSRVREGIKGGWGTGDWLRLMRVRMWGWGVVVGCILYPQEPPPSLSSHLISFRLDCLFPLFSFDVSSFASSSSRLCYLDRFSTCSSLRIFIPTDLLRLPLHSPSPSSSHLRPHPSFPIHHPSCPYFNSNPNPTSPSPSQSPLLPLTRILSQIL